MHVCITARWMQLHMYKHYTLIRIIDPFHITQKYNIIIRIFHFSRQAVTIIIVLFCVQLWLILPTTCTVVGCYNHYSKESACSFYRFPTDPDR